MRARATLVVLLGIALAVGGCWYSGNLGAGTKRPDFGNQRDPDPFADPNRNLTENMWAPNPEKGKAPARGRRRGKQTGAQRLGGVVGAALAYAVAGWSPLVQVSGEFEEDPDQAQKYRAEDRALDEEEARKKVKRVEQAPAGAAPVPGAPSKPSTTTPNDDEPAPAQAPPDEPAPRPSIRLWP